MGTLATLTPADRLPRGGVATLAAGAYLSAATVRDLGVHGFDAWALVTTTLSFGILGLRASPERRAWMASLVLLVGSIGVGGGNRAFASIGVLVAFGVVARRIAGVLGPGGLSETRALPVGRVLALLGTLCGASALVFAADGLGAGLPWARESLLLGLPVTSGALAILWVAIARARRGAFELGVPHKAFALLGAFTAVLSLVTVAAVALAGPDDLGPARAHGLRLACVGLGAGAAAVTELDLRAELLFYPRLARWIGAALLVAAPVMLLTIGSAVEVFGASPLGAALAASVAAFACGVLVPRIARLFIDGTDAHIEAAVHARGALHFDEPEVVIAGVITRLREPFSEGEALSSTSPCPVLFTPDPGTAWQVDLAGYLHARAVPWPVAIADLAHEEPFRLLDVRVLRTLEVRRPDLRPALAWMESEGFAFVVAVAREGEADALLAMPERGRRGSLGIDEAVATKELADQLAWASAFRSRFDRGLLREAELKRELDAATERVLRLERERDLIARRDILHTTRLAEPVVGVYAGAARMAEDALDQRARLDAPTVVLARIGMDAIAHIARAHLAGARRAGPFVVVDGTQSREHDPARWKDAATSPLALAHGGLIVLLDGAALPSEVQRLIGEALAERRGPWPGATSLDVLPWLVTSRDPSIVAAELEPALLARLHDALASVVSLPRLAHRQEDLRAIFTDRLAREGLRQRGRPVGLDDGAFLLLSEHLFAGEDRELALVMSRLVATLDGDVVRADDVRRLGLAALASDTPNLRLVR